MSGQKKNGNSKYKGKYNEFSLYFLKLCLTVKAKTIILLEEQGGGVAKITNINKNK